MVDFCDFKRKVSRNNTIPCYVLKADIRKYFETVDHDILINIIKKRIRDNKVLWLIQKILNNSIAGGQSHKGMPLGNLTSQFFANVYLNELDKFVKHKLKIRYYIRYVDDFVLLDSDKNRLVKYKKAISNFLTQRLDIQLHPDKSKIILMSNRLTFLGFRVFYHHKLLKKSNLRTMRKKFEFLKELYCNGRTHYDKVYDFFGGWFAYAKHANAYKFRKKLAAEIERNFPNEMSTKEINRIAKESLQ